jgi:hypothetical protein
MGNSSSLKPEFPEICRVARRPRAEFYLLQRTALYKRVFHFTVVWVGHMKNFYKWWKPELTALLGSWGALAGSQRQKQERGALPVCHGPWPLVRPGTLS